VLGSVFGLSIPLLEIFIRGSVTFVALLVMMRVIGQHGDRGGSRRSRQNVPGQRSRSLHSATVPRVCKRSSHAFPYR
jgi:hypothetical protein